ncbi:hypothetical protein XELAEV_18012792mg [Xenopus laevis]|uniref:Uncharacterized protein n=1 Tax=Xenopus laevis TaxID=8355 RepID=A0A974DNC0_XENLA|nr:hypothetical protein XELAEV_18012792mg [Xenopus laevis]
MGKCWKIAVKLEQYCSQFESVVYKFVHTLVIQQLNFKISSHELSCKVASSWRGQKRFNSNSIIELVRRALFSKTILSKSCSDSLATIPNIMPIVWLFYIKCIFTANGDLLWKTIHLLSE